MQQETMGLPLVDGDTTITIIPGMDNIGDQFTKFRWNMQVALPYPFPSRTCVKRDVTVAGKPFSFEIHNHFDRLSYTLRSPETGVQWIHTFLHDRRHPEPTIPQHSVGQSRRESLQSVVFFDGQTDYPSASEAAEGITPLMQACMEYLASFLAACQRDAPYLASWFVYPVSLFDVGTVHCEVRGFCTVHNKWELLRSGFQTSMGRRLTSPIFFVDVAESIESATPLDITNELLAEALMASFRGMPRLTVINSYTALESFANAVFSQLKTAALIAQNVAKEYAEQVVEDHRTKHRNDASFLFHSGIKLASGKSLREENQKLYDEIMKIQQLRHRVAHTGYKPALSEARDAHKMCCEAVQWFSGLAGFPVKRLRPALSNTTATVVSGTGFIGANPTNSITIDSLNADDHSKVE